MFGTFARFAAAVVLVVVLGALGVSVYQAGFMAGAAAEGTTVVAPYAYGWGWGIGHGFFGFLGTLLVIFLVFGLLRAIFWRGPRWERGGWGHGRHGHGHHGEGSEGPDGFKGSPWETRAREVHDEWHRRQDSGGSAGSSGSPGGSPG
ncbi:MAG: hypothetical protein L0221_17630 [Chloroflexi bacterium]|nr:hypothetical protein [Chloroflexota bacterium]